jgi:hypothetical protein
MKTPESAVISGVLPGFAVNARVFNVKLRRQDSNLRPDG